MWTPPSTGVPLPERDPGVVSQLLLAGQSERGVAGREGSRPAGPPGQGEDAGPANPPHRGHY